MHSATWTVSFGSTRKFDGSLYGGVLVSTGMIEVREASRGLRGRVKTWKLNTNANDNNLAFAA
jgi:hypothetical protein